MMKLDFLESISDSIPILKFGVDIYKTIKKKQEEDRIKGIDTTILKLMKKDDVVFAELIIYGYLKCVKTLSGDEFISLLVDLKDIINVILSRNPIYHKRDDWDEKLKSFIDLIIDLIADCPDNDEDLPFFLKSKLSILHPEIIYQKSESYDYDSLLDEMIDIDEQDNIKFREKKE